MTKNKREQSPYLQALQALKLRILPEHPKLPLINEKLRRQLSGYRGECAVDYQLTYLPEKDYIILRGIRLYTGEHYFQIDTLLITLKFLLIIEAKSHAGEVTIDEKNHQMVQEIDGTRKVY
ncbi:NERD domain-containing protein [Anaerobacillus alkaliphilus]|uniref:NERD domain-containing protein n=1 Tax=Anaerobacillus alkaliphilus TaxID=1548597 RepID=A0A4Q0VVR9_9BACI|nr:nuclease-related domain-containing protein [Anaerobacillus alkaliphilus]RXJ02928.1 NERD domain-containing protein [Anaerobacillus alkaliphilus]